MSELVGLNIQTPNMFETMSNIAGIMQQRQALEQGAANLQMIQQDARQRRALANIDWDKHTGEDGTLDVNSFVKDQDIRQAAGDAYPQLLQQAAQIKSSQIDAKDRLLNLTNEQVSAFSRMMQSTAGLPDVKAGTPKGFEIVKDTLNNFRKIYGDDAAKAIAPFGMAVHQGGIDSAHLGSMVRHYGQMGQSVSEQQNQQNPITSEISSGTKTLLVNTDKATGERTLAGSVDKGISEATGAGASGSEDEQRYTQISEASTKAQSGATLADQVSNLADQVRTGKLSKYWADQLTVLSQNSPGATARQLLSKYANQLRTTAMASATTDSQRDQISSGMPDPDSMTPDAIKDAALFMKGNFRLNQARAKVADKYKADNKGSTGLRAVDNQFMQHADPFIYAYRELPAGTERQQFLLRHFGDGTKITNPEALKKFKDQMTLVEHYGDR